MQSYWSVEISDVIPENWTIDYLTSRRYLGENPSAVMNWLIDWLTVFVCCSDSISHIHRENCLFFIQPSLFHIAVKHTALIWPRMMSGHNTQQATTQFPVLPQSSYKDALRHLQQDVEIRHTADVHDKLPVSQYLSLPVSPSPSLPVSQYHSTTVPQCHTVPAQKEPM